MPVGLDNDDHGADRLFARFQRTGDPRALGEVYDRLAPELLRVALHTTRDALEAEDVLRDGSNAAFSGCELQILDDFNWESVTKTKLKPWQFTGSLYGSVPAGAHGRLKPLGQWNSYEGRASPLHSTASPSTTWTPRA